MPQRNTAQEVLDTRAIEIATEALTKIEEHKETSEILWKHINTTLTKLNDSIRNLYDWRHKVYQMIIGTLLLLVAWLLINSDKIQFIQKSGG